MRLRPLLVIAFVGVVAGFGACFHSLYNDPDSCSLDPPVACADPARLNCFLGRCFSDTDLPDGAMPVDFSGITMDAAITCGSSAECPGEAPVCQSAKCRGCLTNADDTQCAIHDPGTPRCNTANGRCVQCLLSSDCSTGMPVCGVDQICRKCGANSECPITKVCKTDGACATAAETAMVDNANAACSDSTGAPYCQIQAAVTMSGKKYVSVAGSATAYNAVSAGTLAANVTITIVGPGRDAMPPAHIEQSGATAVSVTSMLGFTTNVTLDGLDLTGSGGGTKKAGVGCSGLVAPSTVTVKNSRIHDSGGYGIDTSTCTLTVDANLIGPTNVGGGINIAQAASPFSITNNIIFNNGTAGRAVNMDDSSTGTFAFNTVVNNNYSSGIGGIECGSGATKPIIGCIVVLNTGGSGAQVGAQCALAATVTTGMPTFVGTTDYRLVKNDPANLACCVDKITPTASAAVDHDVDVGHRPLGQSWDIGAHEVQ